MTKEEKAIIYFKDMRKRLCEDFLLHTPKNTTAYKAIMAEKEFYDTAIQALEQTSWIPVSERLPENGTYLVTIKGIVGEPRIDMKSFAKDLNKVDDFDFPNHKCGWYDYDSEYGYWEDTWVTAWRPLPESYKEESEEI